MFGVFVCHRAQGLMFGVFVCPRAQGLMFGVFVCHHVQGNSSQALMRLKERPHHWRMFDCVKSFLRLACLYYATSNLEVYTHPLTAISNQHIAHNQKHGFNWTFSCCGVSSPTGCCIVMNIRHDVMCAAEMLRDDVAAAAAAVVVDGQRLRVGSSC